MLKFGLPLDVYYEEMNWPPIPTDLCNELVEYSKTAENIWEGKNETIGVPYRNFEHFDVPEKLKEWLHSNIPENLNGWVIRIQCVREGTSVVKHKDGLRRSSFNCVITENSGVTNWYSEDGKLLETIDYKPNVWYHHQAQVVHDVVNINTPRIAVTIYKFEFQPWLIEARKNVSLV